MKIWKLLAAIEVGLLLSIISLAFWMIWQDNPAIDAKVGDSIGLLILVGLINATAIWYFQGTDQ